MDTTQHYSGLVYHPHPPQPHSISDSAPPQPYPQGMAWQVPHHSPPNSSASAHAQMQPMMSHSQEHVEYAPPSAQQSFLSRHPTDPFSLHHPPSPSVESGPSSNQLSFESPQINGSIGPDRGLPRRRLRPLGRVQSHGELPDYAQLPETHDHVQNSHYPPHQGSRPQTPNGPGAPDQFMQLSEQSRLSYDTSGVFPRYAPMPYSQPQSRSTSGSATSAASNPRSASPALSVASALTSVSSSTSAPPSQANAAAQPAESPPLQQKMPGKKKRLYNVTRRQICIHARDHPGLKQEDIAAVFGVERSTVSKILKQKARWLSVSTEEEIHVAKMRPSKFPELEMRLAAWVKAASAQGTILSDALLRQKARQIGDQQGYTPDKFKASSGWLENFKHRHGIKRGVYLGFDPETEKHNGYIPNFPPPSPPSPAPPAPYSAHSPAPEDGPSATDYDVGAVQDDRSSMHQNGQALHPSSITVQSSWPRPDEQQSSEPSSSALMYPDSQHHYPLQQGATRQAEQPMVEAVMPPAEPVPIPIGPENGGSGEQVYVVPVMPEVLEESEVPEAGEAEKALDKVLTYVGANHEDLDLSDADFQLLMEIKYKLFGKATGQSYDSRYAVNHTRS